MKIWHLEGGWQAIRLTSHFVTAVSILLFPQAAMAQIVPDSSVGSTVTPNVEIKGVRSDRIDGGSIRGSNLFHSFSEFNIQNGRGAYFNNPEGITNIFSRITGNNPSNINGILGVLGNANLFLLNPNGIIFGSNARLDLNGSFVATTANAIQLANGEIFSANSSSPTPNQLLNVNPNALLFNQINHQAIINRSTAANTGLQVSAGKSLLLVGGDINLEGGRLRTVGGQIELAGVRGTATVGLQVDGSKLHLSIPTEVQLADISLTNGATVNVSASNGGQIVVNAQNLNVTAGSTLRAGISEGGSPQSQAGNIEINVPGTINFNASGPVNSVAAGAVGNAGNINITTGTLFVTNGGFISAATRGKGNAGNVNIQATNTVSFNGVDSSGNRSLASVAAISTAVGNAGNINITTGSLFVTNGGFLSSGTLGKGNAGNININANSVSFDGFTTSNNITSAFTGADRPGVGNGGNFNITTGSLTVANGAYLSAATLTNGNAGNVNINTDELSITNGGFISAATLGQGNGGSVNVNANSIYLDGVGSNGSPSFITTAVNRTAVGDGGDINITTGLLSITNGARITNVTVAPGRGGNIAINTNRLVVLSGGQILTTTSNSGRAGNITIDATDNITLSGVNPEPQRINERLAITNGPASGIFASTLATATGQGGDLRINTPALILEDGAQVSVSSQGIGSAGNLVVAANSVYLNNFSSLRSEVRAGSQGNIVVNAGDIVLRRGSNITTNATDAATGGNITINTNTLVALENSDITANALFTVHPDGQIELTAKGNTEAAGNAICLPARCAIAHPHPISCQPNWH